MKPKDRIDQTQYHSFDNNMNSNQNLNNNIPIYQIQSQIRLIQRWIC